MKSIKVMLWILIGLVSSARTLAQSAVSPANLEENLFPFVLPWNDDSGSSTDFSFLLKKPAGRDGFIAIGKDGHFYAGKERIRFFGVNLSFSGGMPEIKDAPGVAGRLAKFGVNVVRFHHMDTGAWPNGIRDGRVKTSGELSPEALERLDFFFNELKKRGIYANFNLLVGRPFNAADGLPAEIEKLDWKERHIVGFFNEKHMELQKDYARKLLTRKNQFSGIPYNEEPALAFVEINNEQGLIHSWLGGDVDSLPGVFINELTVKWNKWLKTRYSTDAKLKEAWNKAAIPLGAEMLRNENFEKALDGWNIEQHSTAKASWKVYEDAALKNRLKSGTVNALEIQVGSVGTESWHIQLNQSRLSFEDGKPYTIRFWAKADSPRQISISASQAHDPWQNMGLSANARIGTNWAEYEFSFIASMTDNQSRINFSNFGSAGSKICFANISLKPGGIYGVAETESLEKMSIPYFTKSGSAKRTETAQLDWMHFLYETEDNYWQGIYKFLKNELKIKALVTGTIAGCAPPGLMAKMDWVDTHAYWQHPRFPRRPWDSEDWFVDNRTMVNAKGGTLPGLALKRVYGKPHACTEYNHPAPNTYSSEGFLLLSAYASLQDWDAIYVYSYAHTRSGGWDARKILGFFDVDQHPTKMVTVAPASAMFLRGDVKPANTVVAAKLPVDKEINMLRKAQSWRLVDGGNVGIQSEAALVHRVALLTEGVKAPLSAVEPEKIRINTNRFVSDTGELVWDLTNPQKGVVVVNSEKSKAVIGYGGGKRFELGRFTVEPEQNLQDGWSAITLTLMNKESEKPTRWILTATGYAQNTNMKWKNAEKSSVGRNWGEAPSLVEGISAKISVVNSKSKPQVFALDEKGNRKEQLTVAEIGQNRYQFTIGARWETLWYEVSYAE
ncbi:MAG: carbohydrate binding domain-containing protein [Verrucomicrobiae bacterium]|nr:carbohydrate binding domain-containing protein [Verrucomicrobiae bacterium]